MNKHSDAGGQRARQSQAGESSVPPVAIVLLVAIAGLAALNVYTMLKISDLSTVVDERFQLTEERLALLDGNVNRTQDQLAEEVKRVERVESQVESTQQEIVDRTRQVESRAAGRAESLREEIEATRESSNIQISEVGGRLAEYQQNTDTQVGVLDEKVETVDQKVDAAAAKLQSTIDDLTSVKGDLGVQSGLIATNADELAALKELGERNYYEFNLGRTKKPQRVGPVSVKLSGTDRKRNRYSIELWADDKRIVKRRKTLLEPVQFYVEGTRTPYELVVNNIENGSIAGYLATPKGGPRGT